MSQMEYDYHRSISVMLSKKKKKKGGGKKIETPMWPKIIRGRINMVSNGASKDLDEEAALSKRYVSWMGLLIYMDRGPMMQHELLAG